MKAILHSICCMILFLFFVSTVSALCKSDQVDINIASLVELDELTGIGPAKGQAIIDTRPYESLEDLIDVYGVGEITLQNIKDQGLACVDDEEQLLQSNDEQEDNDEQVEEFTEVKTYNSEIKSSKDVLSAESVISLNSAKEVETIIYESKNEKINKNLLLAFGIFFIGLIYLLLKK